MANLVVIAHRRLRFRSRGARIVMNCRKLIVLLVAIVAISTAHAFEIKLDLGPIDSSSSIRIDFADLNGVFMVGQALSLDFTFKDSKQGRAFSDTDLFPQFFLSTNGSPASGMFAMGTGYLTDINGSPVHSAQPLGTILKVGSINTGIGSILNPGLFGQVYDFYGVHFDVTFPNEPNLQFTDGEFALLAPRGTPIRIGAPVPDNGRTLPLLIGAFGLLVAVHKVVRPNAERSALKGSEVRTRRSEVSTRIRF